MAIPASSAGIAGTNKSAVLSCSAAAARDVGPPHGNMFIVPAASATIEVNASGRIPTWRYSGSMAGTVTMNVLAPAPSRCAMVAMAAVPSAIRMGLRPTTRTTAAMTGSKSPASFITPK